MGTNEMVARPSKSNYQRFVELDRDRSMKMMRARSCAMLTIPSLLPPLEHNQDTPLRLPFSSSAARGVTKLSSKIVSVLMPLDNQPVFEFVASSGKTISPEAQELISTLESEVYRAMSRGNLRDVAFRAIQNLLVVGDVLLVMETVSDYRLIRLDQYVVVRDIEGNPLEIVYIVFVPNEEATRTLGGVVAVPTNEPYYRVGFDTVFIRVVKEEVADENGSKRSVWKEVRQLRNGSEYPGGGIMEVSKYLPLRWTHVDGEDYGRSMVEEIYGDVAFLEASTEALTYSMAAASTFWMRKKPGSVADNKDTERKPIGSWITANEDDVGCISPAATLSPQISAMQVTVDTYSKKVAEWFLNAAASIPTGDRVTAAAIALISNEISDGLGGPFVTFARQWNEGVCTRAVWALKNDNKLDPRFVKLLDDDVLSLSVVTGLQALNRTQQITKLIQMGEIVRALPPQAQARFKWEQYGRTLMSNMGYRPDDWVMNDDDFDALQAKQQAMLAQQQATEAGIGVAASAGAAALQGQPTQ